LNFTQTAAIDGSFTNLTDLTSEGDVSLNGSITTTGAQVYNGTATLVGNTTLAGDSLTLASGVEGANNSLVLNFTQTAAIDGSFTNLTDLTSEGDVSLNGSIATVGAQVYNGTATLLGNTSLAADALSLANGLEGGSQDLFLNVASTSALSGNVVNLANLESVGDVLIDGAISTSGDQEYKAAVGLAGETTLDAANLSFGGVVTGNKNDLTLNVSGPVSLVGGNVTGVANLTSTGGGVTSLSGTLATTGFQNFADDVQLAGNVTLSAGGYVTLGGSLDGAQMLTVTARSSAVTFAGAVGNTTPLGAISLTAASSVTALSTIEIDGTGFGTNGLRIGAGVNNVNMTQPGSVITNAAQAGILLAGGSTGSSLAGFSISGAAQAGVQATSGVYTGTTIGDTSVAGGLYGVFIQNAKSLTVGSNNTVSDAKYGLFTSGNLSDTVITGSTFGNGTIGALLSATTGASINGNNTFSGYSQSVYAAGVSTGTAIANNTIDGAGLSGDFGIYLAGAQGITIGGSQAGDGNRILAARTAIFAGGNLSESVIQGNAIEAAGAGGISYGITLSAASNLIIGGQTGTERNAITDASYGLSASGDLSGTEVRGNDFSNGTAGALLNSATNLAIEGNSTFTDYSLYGVYAAGNSANTAIQGVSISSGNVTTTYGLYLTGASGIEVGGASPSLGNQISNATYGIFAGGSMGDAVIRGNTLTTSSKGQSYGVYLTGAANLTVGGSAAGERNVVTGATYGMLATGVMTNSVVAGNEFANGSIGALLSQATLLTLNGDNQFIGYSGQGIYVFGTSTGTTITNNTIDGVGSTGDFGIYLSSATNLSIGGSGSEAGNRIVNATQGIFAAGSSSGTIIQGNTVTGANAGDYGLSLSKAQGLTVGGTAPGEGNVFENAYYGALASGTLTGTVISGNTFANGTAGILMISATGLALNDGNEFTGQPLYGIYASGSSVGTTIQNNTISNPAGQSEFGIYLTGVQGLTIGGSVAGQGNAISGASRALFAGGNLVGTSVKGNTFTGNGSTDYGVYLTKATSLAIGGTGVAEPNTFTGFTYGGFFGGDLSGTTISSNAFSVGAAGGLLVSATNLTLGGGNTFDNYTSQGLYVTGDNSGTTVRSNVIRGAGVTGSGIFLAGASNVTIGGSAFGQGNQILNTKTGITAAGASAGTVIVGNILRDGITGIALSSSSSLQILGNTMERNSTAGLTAAGNNAGVSIAGNQISANGNGMIITGSNLSITENDIYGNTFNGVMVVGASAIDNSILSNAIFLNGGAGILLSGGGNAGQIAPTVDSVSTSRITGTMTGADGEWYKIQIFKNAASIVTSASTVQGQVLVTEVEVEIVAGSATIDEAVAGVIVGDWITMTATKLTGPGGTPSNTSQFSTGVQVTS